MCVFGAAVVFLLKADRNAVYNRNHYHRGVLKLPKPCWTLCKYSMLYGFGELAILNALYILLHDVGTGKWELTLFEEQK